MKTQKKLWDEKIYIEILIFNISFVQRHASEAIDSGDEFSSHSTQAKDNYDNFDQTIMNLEVSQIEDHINQAPQPTNHNGVGVFYLLLLSVCATPVVPPRTATPFRL